MNCFKLSCLYKNKCKQQTIKSNKVLSGLQSQPALSSPILLSSDSSAHTSSSLIKTAAEDDVENNNKSINVLDKLLFNQENLGLSLNTTVCTTEVTLERSTLEQLYTDKIVVTHLSLYSTNMSHSIASSESDESFIRPGISYVLPSTNLDAASIHSIDQNIRYKLQELKCLASNLNVNLLTQISMIETVYDIKLGNLKYEASKELFKLGKKSNVFDTISAAAKSFRMRLRSKSQDRKANFYAAEKDLIEKTYELQMRSIQLEILHSINEIQMQLQYTRRHNQIRSYDDECDQVTRRHQLDKSNYTTEVAVQRRIRTRHRRRSCGYSSNDSYVSNDRRRNSLLIGGAHFVSSTTEVDHKYKNPNAIETIV